MIFFSLPLGAATDPAWFARVWQTEDGLPEHTIVGLEQTPDGYLWVATHRALARFDGVRFQEFAPAMPAGTAAQIRAMLLDRRGRLWLAKDGGAVICVDEGRVTQVFALTGTLPGSQARAMAEDGNGSIWVSVSAGAVFRIQAGKVQGFGTADGLAEQGFCWLTTDVQGQLWFSQSGSVGVFRNGRFVTLLTLGRQSTRLAAARQGGIWLCSGLKLYRYHEGSKLAAVAELKLEPGRTEADVTALYEDKARGLWMGTASDGLFRYDSQGIQSVGTSNPIITNISEDSEGDLWVGTRGGGLNRLSPRAVQLVGPAAGLPFAAVQSACEDATGTLWAAGQNGALACRSNSVWHLVSNNGGWRGGRVACVAADLHGDVLVGTREKGVFRHQNGAFVPLALNHQLTDLSIRALYISTNGDLWIAVNAGVARLRLYDGSLRYFPLPDGASDVRTMAEDASGDLWMGTTSDGLLLRVHQDAIIDETTNIMSGPQHIRCLQATSDGSLWFGFVGQGLGWLKNGRYFQFRTEHGLWDEYVSQILSDDLGRLWIAGNRGIFRIARSELAAVAEGRASRVKSVILGRGEGVPNLQAAFGICPVASRTRDGRLLMPMLTGLAIVEPHSLRKNPLPPPVIIERLTVNGQIAATYDTLGRPGLTNEPAPASLRLPRGIGARSTEPEAGAVIPRGELPTPLRLGPGVNRMGFEFTALSLASPENVTFRYQLVGLDQDWVDAGAVRIARYPHIPPGDYRFRVTACNQNGIWNEVGASVALTVVPHLWEAVWFRVTAAASAAGLLGGGVLLGMRRRYRRKLERLEQQQVLERERTRIAQDLHDDLGAGLVEINFGSELAQDAALGPDEVREHTREIGTRAREMVTALDEIVWAVNPKHDNVSSLASYFCQFAQHFMKATSVRCHLDVARDLPAAPLNAEQRHSLFLAFKEALSNVVQHSGATDLWLGIAANDGTLAVTVSDNGCGLTPDAPRQRNGADGLDNMQRRLQQLGGCCELTGNVEKGTMVTFKIPLQASAIR
ncbi:MAG: hypothetical protein HY298_22460 [Verrucomicrobia bacterium]|nr:hypothetical protein [Verrucomicrobiota bacterium]